MSNAEVGIWSLFSFFIGVVLGAGLYLFLYFKDYR